MKLHRSLVLLITLLGFAVALSRPAPAAQAASSIFRIEPGGVISGPCGDTWATACDLQHALNTLASEGDELWVAAGTYLPTTDGNRYATFQLRSGIALYGGFAGSETARDQRNFITNVTILSGDTGAPGDSSDNVYHVVTANGTTNTAILDGFHITGGNANGEYNEIFGGGLYNQDGSPALFNVTFSSNTASSGGGGMYNGVGSPALTSVTFSGNSAGYSGGGMESDGGNPTLANVIFTNNSSDEYGGGMQINGGVPNLTNVTFEMNMANYGGGMVAQFSSASLTNVTFNGNFAVYDGGGMISSMSSASLTDVTLNYNQALRNGGGLYNEFGNPTLTDVTIFFNNADDNGGGMYNLFGRPTLMNVTFESNISLENGGGMYNIGESPTLTNVTFTGNQARYGLGGALYNDFGNTMLTNVTFRDNSAVDGGGIYNHDSSPTIYNTILWANSGSQIFNDGDSSPAIYDSVVQGGYAGGTNVISTDPRLGALDSWGGSTQTIPLLPGSSAIDAGNDTTCALTDQRGVSRPQGAHCDIGAFESRGFQLAITSGDGQSTPVNTSFTTPLGLMVSSASGEPVDGGAVNFSAPMSGPSATPNTSFASIAGGTVSLSLTANDIPGSYSVSANTSGAAAGVNFFLTNLKAISTTTLISSVNSSVAGQSVTFTASVSGVSPGGTITFKNQAETIPGCADILMSESRATCTLILSTPGSHSITAHYSGDMRNEPSTGTLTQVVDQAGSTIGITSSANPSNFGEPVTFTATIAATPPGVGVPSGSVQFKVDGANPGIDVTLVDGSASLSTSALSSGTHTITVEYSGDEYFHSSTGTLTPDQTVNPASTTTQVTSSANPSTYGQAVTFTAMVASGGGTPTGSVQFKADGENLGVEAPLVNGIASLTTSALNPGMHIITAEYGGDDNFSTSGGALSSGQTVGQASTTALLTSGANPSIYGQVVSFTATITSSAGTPTGSVQFKLDGANLGAAVVLVDGSTSINTSTLNPGKHVITAEYSGDEYFLSSRGTLTPDQTVNPARTTAQVISSVNPSTYGQGVTFSATIASNSGTPTGTIQFKVDGENLGDAITLTNGSGSISTNSLSPGTHVITAEYSGNEIYQSSTGTLTPDQTVNPARTMTLVTSSANPSTYGQVVTFTAAVTSNSGTPTGTIQFKVDGENLGASVILSDGSASISTSALSPGSHTLTAEYSGADHFASSTGTLAPVQTVSLVDGSVSLAASANPAVWGQSVTITVTVAGSAPGGTVSFSDGGAPITGCQNLALSSGQAACTMTPESTGMHTIRAAYSGDATKSAGSSMLSLMVIKAATTTAIASSANPSLSGSTVTFTVTVSAVGPGSGTPTGTVDLYETVSPAGQVLARQAALTSQTLVDGVATFSLPSLAMGSHALLAIYHGDANFNASTSAVFSQTVDAQLYFYYIPYARHP